MLARTPAFQNLMGNNGERGFCFTTGLLLGNLRGTPAHATNLTALNYRRQLRTSNGGYGYRRRAARQSYDTSLRPWRVRSLAFYNLMVAQEGCQNQMHISGFV